MVAHPAKNQQRNGAPWDATPVADIDAERALLGSLLLTPDALADVRANLRPDHFYREAHTLTYRAMLGLADAGKPLDAVLLRGAIADGGWSKQIAPEGQSVAYYLAGLLDDAGSGACAQHFADRIREKWSKRELRHAAMKASVDCSNGEAAGDIRGRLLSAIADLDIAAASPFPPPIPATMLDAQTEPAVDWLWRGYLARGHFTLITGLWKAGKSTLLSVLLTEMGMGGHLAGSIASASALVVSEESRLHWIRRRDALGFGDHVHFACKPFRSKLPTPDQWQAYVAYLADLTREHAYDAVFIDTIANLSGIENENDNAQWVRALTPLNCVTERGAAVVIFHHPRKGDAGQGQASRGGSALPGFVDVILELRRFVADDHEDRRRVLTAYSRFDETPREQVIELAPDGKSYRSLGDKGQAARSDAVAKVRELLPKGEPGLTWKEVLDEWPDDDQPKDRTLQRVLEDGFKLGEFRRTAGSGRKGHKYFV